MRLRTANEIMLRRLEKLQGPVSYDAPHTFVFKGYEYPCSQAREKIGLTANFGGFDQVITEALIVRVEALRDSPAPAAGHIVTFPDQNNQAYRVLAASMSP